MNEITDSRYKVTQEQVIKARDMRKKGYKVKDIAEFCGMSLGTVTYWTNDDSRAKQKEKNRKNRGQRDNARDNARRKQSWKETPRTYLKHQLNSAKAETRAKRHTVQGININTLNDMNNKGMLDRPNSKIIVEWEDIFG